MTLKHFNEAEISELLTPDAVRKTVHSAFLAWHEGRASTSQRVRCSVGNQMVSSMIAVSPPFSGGKIYATHNGKFMFLVILFDLNGQILATFDADYLTRYRTSALVGLGVEYFHPGTPRSLCIIGAGIQSRTIGLEVLRTNPTIEEVRIYDVNRGAAQTLADCLLSNADRVVISNSVHEAAATANTIITVTSSRFPVLARSDIVGGSLVIGVGATKDGLCEIESDLIAGSAFVICDDIEGSKVECGDLLAAERAGLFEWSKALEARAVFAEGLPLARTDNEIVVFETQGVALQDVAVAGLVWSAAHS